MVEVYTAAPADEYWAAVEDPDEFGSYVQGRIRRYWDHVRRCGLYTRVCRSWRYYHDLFYEEGEVDSRAIRELGKEGTLAGLSVNHLRSLLQSLLTLATQNPPAYDVLAANSDHAAIRQARLGNAMLEHYFHVEKIGEIYKTAVENALALSAGYVRTIWNPSKGRQKPMDPLTGELDWTGDLDWCAPSFFDVAYDWKQPDWQKQRWITVIEYENKWELAARYPDMEEDITGWDSSMDEEYHHVLLDPTDESEGDVVPVTNFYHVGTDALSTGREAKLLGDIVLESGPMLYQDLPVNRVVSGQFLGTAFGYTPAFDLHGLQEAINGEVSTILTNHKSFGVQTLWTPTGGNVSADQISDHLLMIESDIEPKAINFTATPPEIFTMISVLLQQMEYLSGINSVLRGQPETSLKSGRALALVAAQGVQNASSTIASYHQLLEANGTHALRTWRTFADTPRMIALAGKTHKNYIQSITKDDLALVDRVTVQAGNAMTRTLAGRVEMADKLMEQGMVRNREEYVTAITTGQLEPMLEGEEADLAVVREEGEMIVSQGHHVPSVFDPHLLHIREHHALLNSTAAREDPQFAPQVLAAIVQHIQMLMNPVVQAFQVTLGYPTQLPPMPELSAVLGTMMPGMMGGNGTGKQPGEPGAPATGSNRLDQPTVATPESQAAQEPFSRFGGYG